MSSRAQDIERDSRYPEGEGDDGDEKVVAVEALHGARVRERGEAR